MIEYEKICNTCRQPLTELEYKPRKQSIFRSTACSKCKNIGKKKRDDMKAQMREEVLERARKACLNCNRD